MTIKAGMRASFAGVLAFFVASCEPAEKPITSTEAQVVRVLPHDSAAFTQGLFFRDGKLFESTGREGESTIREVALETGQVVRSASLPPEQFGEGSTDWGDQIVSLTWQDGIGYRWRRSDFAPLGTFSYKGEGWGLTNDGKSLIMSDGTAELRFLDPATFAEQRRIRVTADGTDVKELNELEYVDGEILANVWRQSLIARIDPETGKVKGWIGLGAIVGAMKLADPDAVLNGIAYDQQSKKLYVTGKLWPSLYEIKLPPK
jgi:glutamine cyclotransferase